MKIIFLIIWVVLFLYKRYVPILGIKKIQSIDDLNFRVKDLVLVDTRDYQTSYKNPVNHAICLPLPYLYRHHNEIEGEQVILIVTNRLEKNLSIRILRRKGFNIKGYYIPNNIREGKYLYEI